MSEDLNENVVVAYFDTAENADKAATALMKWDDANDDIKLGTIGRVSQDEDGKLKTERYGRSRTGRGALIGGAVGLVTAGLTGGLSLLVGAIGGGAIGGVAGKMGHDHLGVTEDMLKRIQDHLDAGGAALVVLCDDDEVNPTVIELQNAGGDADSFGVAAKVLNAIHETDVARMRDVQMTKNIEQGGMYY